MDIPKRAPHEMMWYKTPLILAFAILSFGFLVKNIRDGVVSVPGYDFRLRYHEAECLKQGIDPYDVISKKIPSSEYALFGSAEAKPGVKTLHVYTPWE